MKFQKYDPKTFKNILDNSDLVAIKFSATWCGPCKILRKKMESCSKNIIVVECDIDEHKNVAVKYNVTSLPTILFFRLGKLRSSKVEGCNIDCFNRLCNMYAGE
jgi:thioredoxin 1